MKKRILSVLITVVMLIGMLPTAVFAAETTYDIRVGGVQVTSANKDNIVVPGATGSATYDPETSTLTLNNFSYTGQGYEYDSLWCAAIFSKNDLTVKVVGSNTVTASVTGSYTAEALNVWGALTITGDSGSSLTLTGAGRDGVGCGGNLKIENVTVNATGTSGLYSDEGNITINNAEVTATATTNQMQYAAAIYAYEGNITIENSTVTANAPHANAVYSYWSDLRYTIKNSNVTISAAKMGIGLTVGTRLFVENSTVEVTSDAGLAIVNDQNNFGAVPRFTGTHVVYAGDDAGSATEADASADATYANKYVKIEPVCTVTVNYGIDGVNNKEIAVTKGDTISLENPVIDGYLFMGWFTDTTYQTVFDFTKPITANTTIYAKFADYEGDKTELNNKIDAAKSDLQAKIDAVNSALAGKADAATLAQAITDLNTAKTSIQTLLEQIDDYADADTALKTELINAINSAKDTINSTIDALTIRVQNLEAGLAEANGKININTTDVGTLKTDVSTLKTWQTEAQNAIEALETLTGTQGTNISALQTAVAELQATMNTANGKIAAAENRIAVLEDKVSALETAKTNLENAVSALQTAVADKADTATVNAAIAELQAAIEALEAVKNNYIGADDDLRTEFEGKIATAKGEAIGAAQLLVDNAKAELQTAIDTKADTATVNAAIANLQNAITALEAAKDNYASADAALKLELEAAIERAKQEAIEASKGYIPYIGTNGNWWIGDTDTGVDANGIKGDTGAPGAQGPQGEKGDKGNTGAAGADGVGIANIEKTSSDGNVDTYTITLTNGTTYTFTVTNGTNGTDGKDGKDGTNGKDGVDGKDGTNGTNGVDGKDGTDGEDGQTPYIGENGNWWIGNTDTGVKAAGDDGKDGAITVATAVGGTALISNIALIAWTLIKKKRLF